MKHAQAGQVVRSGVAEYADSDEIADHCWTGGADLRNRKAQRSMGWTDGFVALGDVAHIGLDAA